MRQWIPTTKVSQKCDGLIVITELIAYWSKRIERACAISNSAQPYIISMDILLPTQILHQIFMFSNKGKHAAG